MTAELAKSVSGIRDVGVQIPRLRCAPFHRSLEVDPIGSAACYDAYLCVEVALPWQRDISMSEPFSSLCEPPAASIKGGDGRKWRPQGLVPSDVLAPAGDERSAGTAPRTQVTSWERLSLDDGATPEPLSGEHRAGRGSWVGPLARRDWLVDPALTRDLCAALLSGESSKLAPFEKDRAQVSGPAIYVCTHGQRDVCCGSMGTELFGEIEHLDGVEVRRCSHTGGHRFASTAITFPDAYAWAHLDASLAESIVRRTVDPRDIADHCRGSTLIESGPAQVADRHGLCEVGWEWADATRAIELIGFERRSMATDLRVTGVLDGGAEHSFEMRIGVERHVPQISCGAISEPEYKVEPIWRVESARRV